MPKDVAVADHYTHGALLEAIRTGVEGLGKTTDTVTIDDLAPIDEFHIGGRQASVAFLDQLSLTENDHVLDVGCGMGGGARFAAAQYGCEVTGIDLTQEFVDTGNVMSQWVDLDRSVSLKQGSALELPFGECSFDAAFMMHVGMNIADKTKLFAEISRVLKPGGRFGVYDLMKVSEGQLGFPVPWAKTDATSSLATPEEYRDVLTAAGLSVDAERNRRDFALDFFAELSAKAASADGPPPLGLHVLMGESRAEKVKNMIENISACLIASVEIVCRK